MATRGAHPRRALSEARILAPLEAGRYADGNCLYLVVDPSGAKRWMLRTMVRGRRRDIGLGGLSSVPLAEARERAATLRKEAREGGDPLATRRRARASIPTFEEAARSVHGRCREILGRAKNLSDGADVIFTGRTAGSPLANMAFLRTLRGRRSRAESDRDPVRYPTAVSTCPRGDRKGQG